jgi:hypothetical protein
VTGEPGDGAEPRLGVALSVFVEDMARAERHLRAYFHQELEPDGSGRTFPLFSGALFEPLAASSPPDEITEADLVAVTALGVSMPPRAAAWLLDGDGRETTRDLLTEVGPDRPITDVDVDDLDHGSPAAELWELLRGLPDVGPVTAGKLLAAKRPSLIPVWDQHVQAATQAPDGAFWRAMRAGLLDHRRPYEDLRENLALKVSLLRVVDVVIWMHQHGHLYLPS